MSSRDKSVKRKMKRQDKLKLKTDVETCNVSPEDSLKKNLKINELPDPDRSNQLASTCCTRDRNELLHDIKKFDPSTLKPGHIESTRISSQSIMKEIMKGAMISWKNGIHPNDPLAAKFGDTEESDNDSDDDDDDDFDEWDD